MIIRIALLACSAAAYAADAASADPAPTPATAAPAKVEAVAITATKPKRQDPILRYDLDHDGALSKEEIDAIPRGRSWARIISLDTNGDGMVDADEIAASKARHAKRTATTSAAGM